MHSGGIGSSDMTQKEKIIKGLLALGAVEMKANCKERWFVRGEEEWLVGVRGALFYRGCVRPRGAFLNVSTKAKARIMSVPGREDELLAEQKMEKTLEIQSNIRRNDGF